MGPEGEWYEEIYPPSQIATGVSPWMNTRRVSSVALAKDDTLRHAAHRLRPTGRRVAPDEACRGCHGRKPVGLHSEKALALERAFGPEFDLHIDQVLEVFGRRDMIFGTTVRAKDLKQGDHIIGFCHR